MQTLVCISDTHNHLPELPAGDILIHAGDATMSGSQHEIFSFLEKFGELPFKHKILVPGNHDFGFETEAPLYKAECKQRCIHLLEDSGITLEGINFWGSPVQPRFFDWAFNRDRGVDIKKHWDLIPDGIDVLVTHGPPLGHLDRTEEGLSVGCEDLLDAVKRVKPSYHIFGHIHEAYGNDLNEHTRFINASIMNRRYRPTNQPQVFLYG